jgi:hypothetical protein
VRRAQEQVFAMERDLPPLNSLLIAPSGPPPSAADLAALMRRIGVAHAWSDAAVAQLAQAAAAADRWLAIHPEEAARLVEDPAGAVVAMRDAGLLTGPVDDLLATLKALAAHGAAKRARRPALDPAAVRVGPKPALRSRYPHPTTEQRAATRTAQAPRADQEKD